MTRLVCSNCLKTTAGLYYKVSRSIHILGKCELCGETKRCLKCWNSKRKTPRKIRGNTNDTS